MKQNKDIPEIISVPAWYRPGGGMMYKRDCLPSEHPGSIYNYIKNELKLNPEDYGYFLSPVDKLFREFEIEIQVIKTNNLPKQSYEIIDKVSNTYIHILKRWFREHSAHSLDRLDREDLY